MKSAPELWAECSDAASLARHLGRFGEIRITKLEPETAVAWEGSAASGTVTLEPSGWGTRVTLTVAEVQSPEGPDAVDQPAAPTPEPAALAREAQPAPDHEPPEPVGAAAPPPPKRFGWLRSLFARGPAPGPGSAAPEAALAAAPEAPLGVAPDPSPVAAAPVPPGAQALDDALDSLGRAHHRPYSRA